MKFWFCETCGKRLTDGDIASGAARDKKLRGVYCDKCAVGIATQQLDAISESALSRAASQAPTQANLPIITIALPPQALPSAPSPRTAEPAQKFVIPLVPTATPLPGSAEPALPKLHKPAPLALERPPAREKSTADDRRPAKRDVQQVDVGARRFPWIILVVCVIIAAGATLLALQNRADKKPGLAAPVAKAPQQDDVIQDLDLKQAQQKNDNPPLSFLEEPPKNAIERHAGDAHSPDGQTMRTTPAASPPVSAPEQQADGGKTKDAGDWIDLFNSKDTAGWHAAKGVWVVEAGALAVTDWTAAGARLDTVENFADFEFECQLQSDSPKDFISVKFHNATCALSLNPQAGIWTKIHVSFKAGKEEASINDHPVALQVLQTPGSLIGIISFYAEKHVHLRVKEVRVRKF